MSKITRFRRQCRRPSFNITRHKGAAPCLYGKINSPSRIPDQGKKDRSPPTWHKKAKRCQVSSVRPHYLESIVFPWARSNMRAIRKERTVQKAH